MTSWASDRVSALLPHKQRGPTTISLGAGFLLTFFRKKEVLKYNAKERIAAEIFRESDKQNYLDHTFLLLSGTYCVCLKKRYYCSSFDKEELARSG